jgi:hypothetical protein
MLLKSNSNNSNRRIIKMAKKDKDIEDEEEEEEEEDQEPEKLEEDNEEQEEQTEKVGSIDSLVFLKEYAKDINRQYTNAATKLGISKSSAHNYLMRCIYLIRTTLNDLNFLRRARLVLNKNVPDKYHISNEDIIKLKPLIYSMEMFLFQRTIHNLIANQTQHIFITI